MKMRGHGSHWQRFSILFVGLITFLPIGSSSIAAPSAARTTAPNAAIVRAPASSPPELALRLQSLLGQHAVLAADFMRGRIRGDDNFAQAADAALGKNTEAMAGLIGGMFGDAVGKAFAPVWTQHVVELFSYARGLAEQDDAVKAEARKKLIEYEGVLASFFVAQSGGRLPKAAADQAVKMHVDHLLMQADAYAAHDYATADRIYRESYEHTYDLGGTVAATLLPAKDAAALQAPVWRLRSQLGKLLAEHVVLVEDVTRAAVTNAPDVAAAGQSVNANTRNLATAVDSLFGAPAAKGFQGLWAYHVDQLVAYAGAAAAHDSAGRDRVVANLRSFETRMAGFLQTATGRRLDATGLIRALLAHDQMLMRHTDAFVAKDYRTAHDIAYQTYEHMYDLARQLADAFGATVAARVPVGAAQTGQGGMAHVVERR
jgi:hypothetical protein